MWSRASRFADPDRRPPVVLVNHAGRVFGTGYAVADAIAWLRPGIAGLLHPRRGIPEERMVWLPIPLTPPAPSESLARITRRTRTRLGIPAHGVCVVTMASPGKYRPIDEVSLPDLLAGATRRHGDLHVLVIGPRPQDGWSDAIAWSGGRMHVLGPRPDPRRFLAAADFAVDSAPDLLGDLGPRRGPRSPLRRSRSAAFALAAPACRARSARCGRRPARRAPTVRKELNVADRRDGVGHSRTQRTLWGNRFR